MLKIFYKRKSKEKFNGCSKQPASISLDDNIDKLRTQNCPNE